MHSNIFLRVCSSAVMVPLVWAVVWFGQYVDKQYEIPLFKIFLAFMGFGLAWEWEMMFHKKMTLSGFWLLFTTIMAVFLSENNVSFAIWVMLVGTTFVYWKDKGNLAFALGTIYICLPLLSLSYLYFRNGETSEDTLCFMNLEASREMMLWLFFVVWATDVGGYIVGKTVGGPKLCPTISPKKTWSGLLGGIVFAMIVAYVFALYLKAHGYVNETFQLTTNLLVFSAGGLAAVSQGGDLFESFIKRRLNLKDSSNLIPGHGGVFDRVDGLLFASVVMAWVIYLISAWGMES